METGRRPQAGETEMTTIDTARKIADRIAALTDEIRAAIANRETVEFEEELISARNDQKLMLAAITPSLMGAVARQFNIPVDDWIAAADAVTQRRAEIAGGVERDYGCQYAIEHDRRCAEHLSSIAISLLDCTHNPLMVQGWFSGFNYTGPDAI